MASPGPEIDAFLVRAGLVAPGAPVEAEPLAGGVSSDIWRIRSGDRAFVVKRALERLRVAQLWQAPVGRNASEVGWMREAARAAPGSVPAVLAHDADAGAFAMDWLDPAAYPVWKDELAAGRADPDFAAAVGRRIAAIHAGTTAPDVATRFDTGDTFHAIRLEPYLEATARAHADLAGPLMALSETTAATRRALVHGDVSPKNILAGPGGPVFLDAECAWFGDPAFDLAFCINHLLLKCLLRPPGRAVFLACFDALAAAYLAGVTWEPAAAVENRAARLLPGLLLARIDGKSPVEYVAADGDRALVRRIARALLTAPPSRLAAVRGTWGAALEAAR